MAQEYCHKHGNHNCQNCMDDWLDAGIEADKNRTLDAIIEIKLAHAGLSGLLLRIAPKDKNAERILERLERAEKLLMPNVK